MAPSETRHQQRENPIALELRGVSKTFRSDTGAEVRALEHVNLVVREGEFVTLVGATGCGKTTLLNLIAELDTAEEGYLDLGDGLRFGDNIAHVFQHYTFPTCRSGCRCGVFREPIDVPEPPNCLPGSGLRALKTLIRMSYPAECAKGQQSPRHWP